MRLKKYLYVIRPLLAVRWIDQGLGMPPTAFAELMAGTVHEPGLMAAIEALLAIKRRSGEAAHGPRDEVLHGFIETELGRAAGVVQVPVAKGDTRLLDAFLREQVLQRG